MEQKLDIVELIELNPITKLSKDYQSKFLQKIQENFTESQQKLFMDGKISNTFRALRFLNGTIKC